MTGTVDPRLLTWVVRQVTRLARAGRIWWHPRALEDVRRLPWRDPAAVDIPVQELNRLILERGQVPDFYREVRMTVFRDRPQARAVLWIGYLREDRPLADDPIGWPLEVILAVDTVTDLLVGLRVRLAMR